MSSNPEEHSARHPTFKQYVVVATFLFVITLIEFLIIVPEGLRGASAAVAPLIILSAIKFAAVVMFYMHLKFDSRLFTYIFVGGLALGLAVGLALIGLFGTFQPEPREFAEANAVPFEEEHGGDGPAAGAELTPTPEPTEAPEQTTPEATEPPDTQPTQETETETGGGEAALVAQGEEIFTGSGGCASCHMIEGISQGMVGPDLTNIGADAADRKPDMDAREYIMESIRDPEAFVASDVARATPGIMTSGITAGLSDEEVEALTEFLLAQQ